MGNKFIIFFIGMFILINMSLVSATIIQPDEYDYYFGVGEPELFKHYTTSQDNLHKIVIEGLSYNLTKDTTYFYTYITCSNSENLNYDVIEINDTLTIFNNYTDGVFESNINMDANKIYAFNKTETNLHALNSLGNYIVCADIKKNGSVNRNIKFHVGQSNGTSIKWSSSPINRLITSSSYTYICSNILSHTYTQNLSSFQEYFGVSCIDCSSTQTLDLRVDFNNNNSNRIFNSTTTFYNYTSIGNFGIYATAYEEDIVHLNSGEFRCRNPFYYDIYLQKENESSSFDILSKKNYCDEFSYIVLTPYSEKISKKISNNIDGWLKYIPGYSSIPKLINTQYTDVVFWNTYDSCHAKVKLYEFGNYSIFAVYSKIKPEFKEFVDVRGDYLTYLSDLTGLFPIEAIDNTNKTITIHASLWELSNERYIGGYLHIGLIIGMIILIPIILIFAIKRLFR